jgi:hypothetical protein
LTFDTLSLPVTFYAIVMIGMTAHKVNAWQSKLFLALSAFFGTEGFCLSAYLYDLGLHLRNSVHVLIDLLFGLFYHFILLLQAFKEVRP